MQRRDFIRNTALTAGTFLLSRNGLMAAMQQPYTIKMLNTQMGIFTEKGGTIAFLLSTSGIVVVDAEFPEQSAHLIAALQQKSKSPFQLLINTHHHADHTSGNISFSGKVKNVVAHANSKTNQEKAYGNSQSKQLYPDTTYTDTWQQKLDKETIHMSYYGAAHTNGDSVVYFEKNNIIHIGDLVFNRRHPYVDRSAGASIKSWMQVLDKVLAQYTNTKTTFVFGHAGDGYNVTGSQEDIKLYRSYLENVWQCVEKNRQEGKTKEEILKIKTIPGSPQWQGEGIERPLTAAFEEMESA